MSAARAGSELVEIFPLDGATIRGLIPTIFKRAGYDGVIDIQDATNAAFVRKTSQVAEFQTATTTSASIHWDQTTPTTTVVTFAVTVGEQRAASPEKTEDLRAVARLVVAAHRSEDPIRKAVLPEHDPVVRPGERFEREFTGTLRDYSGCADAGELTALEEGALPLGQHAFGFDEPLEFRGKKLFLSQFTNGGRMEYNGVLVCAPQNSGKTVLVTRWAEAATKAKERPHAVFMIDVKGNLRDKIEDRLAGPVYWFSTDPRAEDSDRINFLDGPKGLDAIDTDRIRQLATALLPSRGFVERGGLDEYHYRNRVIWLTAFIHIAKLAEHYCSHWFRTPSRQLRSVDLGDVYELMEDEDTLLGHFEAIRQRELEYEERGEAQPARGVSYWMRELAIMLDPKKINIGQRVDKDSYREFTIGMLSALEPFAPNGTMHQRTRSIGPGRLFDIETVLGGAERPVTIVLSARQQDLDKSAAVLSLAIKRLQWFLFDRMVKPKAEIEERPVLLLLDETRRIRDFDAAEYVSFAREAKAGCMVVYQALDQIGPPEKITELLENIGTQIYLGSLVGNTAKYFTSILPRRSRTTVTSQIVRSTGSETTNTSVSREQVDYFSTTDLYRLPAGPYPALVLINDLPRRKPFLVDVTDPEQLPRRAP